LGCSFSEFSELHRVAEGPGQAVSTVRSLRLVLLAPAMATPAASASASTPSEGASQLGRLLGSAGAGAVTGAASRGEGGLLPCQKPSEVASRWSGSATRPRGGGRTPHLPLGRRPPGGPLDGEVVGLGLGDGAQACQVHGRHHGRERRTRARFDMVASFGSSGARWPPLVRTLWVRRPVGHGVKALSRDRRAP
jgi:hypothetical protein